MTLKTVSPFKFLGNYDVTSFFENIDLLDWGAYTDRQKKRLNMKDTGTIPLIWDIDFTQVNVWPYHEMFAKQVQELNDLMCLLFGTGEMCTCVLTNLPASTKIDMHFDDRIDFFKNTNRVHIPITTNDDVIFKVGDQERNMKVGEMWEINNYSMRHGVFNNGSTDRIHLMIDWKFNSL
jgi:hypothetical protein